MTAQVSEKLIYEGEPMRMTSCPPIPAGQARIVAVPREEAGKDGGLIFSTACWRNYIGAWAIRGGKLYLTGLEGIFRLQGEEPLFADWVSEVLRAPRGEMLRYVHMGFESVYEEDLLIQVENGVVIKTWVVDHREDETPKKPVP